MTARDRSPARDAKPEEPSLFDIASARRAMQETQERYSGGLLRRFRGRGGEEGEAAPPSAADGAAIDRKLGEAQLEAQRLQRQYSGDPSGRAKPLDIRVAAPPRGESAEQQQQNAPPPDQHQQQHHLGEVEVPPGRGAPHGLTISPDNSDPVRVTDYYPGDLVAGDEAHLGESGDDSNASQAPGGGGSGGGHVKFGTNPAEGGPVHDVVFDPVRGISIGPVADHAGAVYEASQPGGRGVRRRNPLIIHSPREPARHGDSSTDAANAAGCVHHSHGDHGGAAPAAAVQTDLPAGVGSTTVDDADAADRGSGSTPPSDPAAREGRSGGGGGTSGLAHVGVTAVKNFVGGRFSAQAMRGGGGGDPLRHHASNAVKDGASPGLSSYGTSDARQRQPQTGSEGVIVAELGHKVSEALESAKAGLSDWTKTSKEYEEEGKEMSAQEAVAAATDTTGYPELGGIPSKREELAPAGSTGGGEQPSRRQGVGGGGGLLPDPDLVGAELGGPLKVHLPNYMSRPPGVGGQDASEREEIPRSLVGSVVHGAKGLADAFRQHNHPLGTRTEPEFESSRPLGAAYDNSPGFDQAAHEVAAGLSRGRTNMGFNTERSLPSEERLRSLIHGGVGEVAAATPTRREGAAGTTEGAAGEAPEGGGGGGGTSLAGLVTGLVSAVGHRLVEASNMEEVEASGGLADWEAEDDKTKYEELHAREQSRAFNTGINAPTEGDIRAETETSVTVSGVAGGPAVRSVLDVVSRAIDSMVVASNEEEVQAGGGLREWEEQPRAPTIASSEMTAAARKAAPAERSTAAELEVPAAIAAGGGGGGGREGRGDDGLRVADAAVRQALVAGGGEEMQAGGGLADWEYEAPGAAGGVGGVGGVGGGTTTGPISKTISPSHGATSERPGAGFEPSGPSLVSSPRGSGGGSGSGAASDNKKLVTPQDVPKKPAVEVEDKTGDSKAAHGIPEAANRLRNLPGGTMDTAFPAATPYPRAPGLGTEAYVSSHEPSVGQTRPPPDERGVGDKVSVAVSGTAQMVKDFGDILSHGGPPAPHAIDQGNISDSKDVARNVERSEHLEDPVQKRIYDAETVKIAPLKEAHADQVAQHEKDAAEGGPHGQVLGQHKPYSGAKPHGKPPGPGHLPAAPVAGDRFSAVKGAFGQKGTGAQGDELDDSVKAAVAAVLAPETEHQPHAASRAGGAAATRCDDGGGKTVDGVGSGGGGSFSRGGDGDDKSSSPAAAAASGGGGGGGWAAQAKRLASSVVRNVGASFSAKAKEPTGKEVKEQSTLLVIEDPATHRPHVAGYGGAVSTRRDDAAAEPSGHEVGKEHGFPAAVGEKVSQAGRALRDTATRAEGESSTVGKDSAGRPALDALLKHSPIPEVLHRLEGMPREAGQLADKVVEAGAGVVEKVEEEAARAAQVATNLVKYADTKSGEERLRERQAVVEGLAQDVVNEAEPGPGTAYSLQRQRQLERMMAAGDPAFKNETLKDKITYPFSKDAHDETEARRLADNYLHYREDKTKELEASQEAREAKEAKEGGGSKPPGWGGGGDTKTIVHQVPALAAGATRGGPQGSGAKQEALAERAPRMGKEMKEEWKQGLIGITHHMESQSPGMMGGPMVPKPVAEMVEAWESGDTGGRDKSGDGSGGGGGGAEGGSGGGKGSKSGAQEGGGIVSRLAESARQAMERLGVGSGGSGSGGSGGGSGGGQQGGGAVRHEVVAEDRGHVPRHHGVTAADVERQEEAAAAAAAGGGGEGREGGAGSAALLAAGGGQEEAWENPIEAALEAVQEAKDRAMERGALEGEEEASDSIPEVPFTSTEQLAMEREAAQRRREQT